MNEVKAYLMFLKDDLLSFVKAGTALDPSVFVICMAIILAWLMCACFASSIAEKKGYSPRANFLWGLLFPMAYPIILVLKAPKYQADAEKRLAAERAKEAKMSAQEDEEDMDEETFSLGEPEELYDQEYFDRLVFETEEDDLALSMTVGGNAITVKKIVDCLENVLVAEVVDENRVEKKLRIPYAKIEQCDTL